MEEKEREIRQLKAKLEEAVRQSVRNRENWFRSMKTWRKKQKSNPKERRRDPDTAEDARETTVSRDQWKEKYLEQLHLRYDAETALEEEKGKNLKLMAQLNRDYENSSIPSSKQSS